MKGNHQRIQVELFYWWTNDWCTGSWLEYFCRLQVASVWTLVRACCAAVGLASPVPTARSTLMIVLQPLARMQEPVKMVWMTTPALARWATLARTAACDPMPVENVRAKMVAHASPTLQDQCASAQRASWGRAVSSHCRAASSQPYAKLPTIPRPPSPSPAYWLSCCWFWWWVLSSWGEGGHSRAGNS